MRYILIIFVLLYHTTVFSQEDYLIKLSVTYESSPGYGGVVYMFLEDFDINNYSCLKRERKLDKGIEEILSKNGYIIPIGLNDYLYSCCETGIPAYIHHKSIPEAVRYFRRNIFKESQLCQITVNKG